MRIAVDARLVHTLKAGSGHYCCNLLRALGEADDRNEYVLFTGPAYEQPPVVDRPDFLEVRSPRATLMSPNWEQFELPRVLAVHAADLLLSFTLVLPLLCPVPTVTVLYDIGFELFPEFYAPGLRDYLRAWVPASLHAATRIVAISEATRRDAVALYDQGQPDCEPIAGRTQVVYPAVSESFRPAVDPEQARSTAKRYGLTGPYALTVCSLERNKNLPRVIEAFAGLRVRAPESDLSLALVGRPGPALGEIQRLTGKHGLNGRVVVTGYVPDKDLPALYQCAEMFVFPSLYEGFGLPPLEAMSCGTPVIVSDRASLPEVVGEAGMLVDLESPDAIAGAMQRLLQEPDLRSELSRRGLEQAQRFSWRTTAEQFLGLMERVQSERREARAGAAPKPARSPQTQESQ